MLVVATPRTPERLRARRRQRGPHEDPHARRRRPIRGGDRSRTATTSSACSSSRAPTCPRRTTRAVSRVPASCRPGTMSRPRSAAARRCTTTPSGCNVRCDSLTEQFEAGRSPEWRVDDASRRLRRAPGEGHRRYRDRRRSDHRARPNSLRIGRSVDHDDGSRTTSPRVRPRSATSPRA